MNARRKKKYPPNLCMLHPHRHLQKKKKPLILNNTEKIYGRITDSFPNKFALLALPFFPHPPLPFPPPITQVYRLYQSPELKRSLIKGEMRGWMTDYRVFFLIIQSIIQFLLSKIPSSLIAIIFLLISKECT